ncbi:tyrosine-type recombinase/integrase [Allorhizobium ampelinum]|uniref:tyrosine-type recombinase/integrase n=1 Tax=Allorhizobium ampelinum TaxID=3025782 RepID=UPI000B3FB3F3|nr:site-specific integrase [Allorhizobium ampelinum]NTA27457.1 site-specific integrase [Allorhizobium ampelinum]OVE94513.1 site-specific integrase [Allorhizobium ampelinum]
MSIKLYRRPGGKIWHYRGTVKGRLYRGSTGSDKKDIAQRFISDLENSAWKGHLDGPGAILTFEKAVELYLAAQKPDRFMDDLVAFWKDKLVKDMTSGIIRQSAIVKHPRASGATRNRNFIVPTQAVINHCAKLEFCNHVKVERFKIETKQKKPTTWEWVQAFMDHSNPHLGAICCFMFLTGARVSEAIGLKWADVDLRERKALIRQTKVGKDRVAHLPPPLMAAIANIEGDSLPEANVFKYSSRHTLKPQWNKVFKRAGIEPLTFHSCRHGFATALLHKGVDPITVAKLGGWADAQLVFKTYGHAMTDETLADLITETQNQHTTEMKKRKFN